MSSLENLKNILKEFNLKDFDFVVDHNCVNYPDGLFFNISNSMVCPFCGFVWGNITKHKSWKLLTVEQQNKLLPIWKEELDRKMKLYGDKETNLHHFELHGDLPDGRK